jgi:hypothetical protein
MSYTLYNSYGNLNTVVLDISVVMSDPPEKPLLHSFQRVSMNSLLYNYGDSTGY